MNDLSSCLFDGIIENIKCHGKEITRLAKQQKTTNIQIVVLTFLGIKCAYSIKRIIDVQDSKIRTLAEEIEELKQKGE